MRYIFLFFLISSFIQAESVNILKNKMKKIDKEIKQKSNRIEAIDTEKVNIKNQINKITKEIDEIKEETEKLKDEIAVVNRNIQYGSINLDVSNKVLKQKKEEYKAKIIGINRVADHTGDTRDRSMVKRSFTKWLYGDLEKIDYVKTVKGSIEVVKQDIEEDKRKLTRLKRKLDSNRLSIERKIKEKERLVEKLNDEKTSHQKKIATLKKQKKDLEKEIERIIRQRSTTNKNVKLNTAVLKLGKFIRPVQGQTVVWFKSRKNGAVVSNGIEIRARMGSKIKAAKAGKVIYADKFQGLNNVVMIDHGYNTISVYGNLIGVGVGLNQRVAQGQDIGVLGLTTDGEPNLYYEVRFNLKPINPESLF